MKKILLAAALLAATSSVFALDAPGQNWSSLTYNPSPIRNTREDDNVLLQGRVEQGLIVGRISGFKVNAFGALNYGADKNGLSYNNKIAPSIGVKLQRNLGSAGIVEVGVAVVHQNNFRGVTSGPSSGTGVQAFISVWNGWNFGR
jgi:nucleoside-specific outer membrane channel protein Tsx